MRILIEHQKFPNYTKGTLYILESNRDGTERVIYQCKVLELPWRNNENGVSCICDGIFPIVLEYSENFGRKLWELKEVPGRSEVKIHIANFLHQLLGCIAPGLAFGDIDKDGVPDILNSKKALDAIHLTLFPRTVLTIQIKTIPL